MAKKGYGRTVGDEPITEEVVEKLTTKAEEGFDVEEILRRRGGRPATGSSAASVESVRPDPELSEASRDRAEHEGRTNSDLIRDALCRYLKRANAGVRRVRHRRDRVATTERGTSSCIASGAVNGAVYFGNTREQTGLNVTCVARIAS